MRFNELPEFQKEFKKLQKKYKSLPKDFKIFLTVLNTLPTGNSKHFNILHSTEDIYIVKARFFCKYLKGSSLRIVYAYFEKEKRFESLEIYYKGNKKSESKERIKEYLSCLK